MNHVVRISALHRCSIYTHQLEPPMAHLLRLVMRVTEPEYFNFKFELPFDV